MKKTILNSLLLLTVFVAVSCGTSLKVNYDYDRSANFSDYKTFSIYPLKSTGSVSQLNVDRIMKSIRAEMIRKGYIEDNNKPDLLLNAVTVVKDKKYVSATTNYYGYGGLYRPYAFWGAPMSGRTSFQVYDYKNGSLMLDVVDAGKNKLVWQGSANAEMDKQPKNPEEAISKAITKILAGFPSGNSN